MRSKKLDKKTLAYYKNLLLEKREELLGDISQISEETLKKSQKDASGDISGYSFHMADVATDNYDREFSLGLASKERNVLFDINHALDKLQDGAFGLCEACKKPISKIRLKAVPYASLCLKCQQQKEKRP
ncbi:MAG: TraR/DksA family transcriptional regulator [Candidatus Omnitrophota bacterium]